MPILRSNINYAKQLFSPRLGNDYVYGGWWTPDPNVGCDCSGLVTSVLSAIGGGPDGMVWGRRGLSTESYRYKPLGGPQHIGPFICYHVSSPAEFPADSVARISLHHEGEGGPDSHMNVQLDGVYMESSGSYGCCTLGASGPPIYGGAIAMSNPFWNDWWFVAGPIVEDVGGTDYTAPPVPELVSAQFL